MNEKKPAPRVGVRQFRVGTDEEADFHPAEIEAWALKIAQWYSDPRSGRRYDDPLATAQEHLRQCLLAENSTGGTWGRCPTDMVGRIRSKCNYDLETDGGITRGNLHHPNAGKTADTRAKRETNRAMKGIDPVTAAFDQEAYRATIQKDILSEFPELDNPVHAPNVDRLALIYAQQKLVDQELSLGGGKKERLENLEALTRLEKSAETTMKLLDIHPEQLRKKLDGRRDGTVGELIALLEADDDFAERERLWALQAALQLWWMSAHPNGRGDGPQVEPWEIYHATRTKPAQFRCPCCQKEYTLIEGFTPEELRDYLVRRGVLVMEPAIPKLIPEDALGGLDGAWQVEAGAVTMETPAAEEVADGGA